jgi:hypothetical protein
MSQLEMGTRWLHKATGSVYTIICNATNEADMKPVVVYLGDDGRIWVRRADLFLDGRFQRLKDD